MATYQELMAEAQEKMRQAEEMRRQEMAGAIAEIKQTMQKWGITVADLTRGTRSNASASKGPKGEPKYKGPLGELWSGGPGRKPEWVKKVVEAGEDLEKYRI